MKVVSLTLTITVIICKITVHPIFIGKCSLPSFVFRGGRRGRETPKSEKIFVLLARKG